MIAIADNFQYRGTKPLDGRIMYSTVANMVAVPDSSLYDGCMAYVTATKKNYQYDSSNTEDETLGKWREYSSGSSLPTGGTTNQALVKNSNNDLDFKYKTIYEVPSGGTTGQILTKNSSTDNDTAWTTVSGVSSYNIQCSFDIQTINNEYYSRNLVRKYGKSGMTDGSYLIAPVSGFYLVSVNSGQLQVSNTKFVQYIRIGNTEYVNGDGSTTYANYFAMNIQVVAYIAANTKVQYRLWYSGSTISSWCPNRIITMCYLGGT